MTEAQAGPRWIPPTGPLGELTRGSAERARASEVDRVELIERISAAPQAPSFVLALRGAQICVIAELKRRSPSKGSINEDLAAGERAMAYEVGGAAALSVLTEHSRFGGSLDDLRDVRRSVQLPLLRKDFITAPIQLLEARAYGASAVLLIARALEPARLEELAGAAAALGLECLVEVRNERELGLALAIAGAAIGVNNRDLETLEIDDAVGARLLPLVPPERIAVYESGVRGIAEVERAAAAGADAVLVGSVLSNADDGARAVRDLTGVPRHARA